MSQLFINIYHFLGNISLAFEGHLGEDDAAQKKMRDEVLYGTIPNYSTDKANLKNDSNLIAKDLHNALEDYKLEHEHSEK